MHFFLLYQALRGFEFFLARQTNVGEPKSDPKNDVSYSFSQNLGHFSIALWARKFKKVQARKSHEIK